MRLVDEGNAIEESGRFSEAMRRYESAIELAPDLARAHMNRGNILLAMDDAEGALGAYTTALILAPDYAAAHYNVGHAHLRLKDKESARAAYEKAIQLKPDFVDAHVALGCVLDDLKQFDGAVASYRKALEIAPDYAEVHGNLGNALNELGLFNDAAAAYRKALDIDPELTDIHLKLGHTLKLLHQPDAALACFHAAVKCDPQSANAHFSLGIMLKELMQLDKAVDSLRRATAIDPVNPEAHINLGEIFTDLSQPANAFASYRRALEIKPDHAVAHSNMGNVHMALGQFDDAMACYRRAIEIQPDFAAAHSNLGVTLKDVGRPLEALASTRRALEISPELTAARSNLLFTENSICRLSAAQLLAEAKQFGAVAAGQARAFTNWLSEADPDRCLRIGFVSGDLRDHAVGHFVEGVLRSIAAKATGRLEIHAYPTYFCTDSVSQRIKASCHGWHAVAGLHDEALANKIRNDRIDILIDLSGHTAHNRLPLFAWKPAPIQVTWLGYLATTGVSAIDYLIADEWTLPVSEETCFTEKIWRLPESYLCFTPPQGDTPVGPLPALGNGYVTFGSFNNLTKVSDEVIALWACILSAVPGSRLFLKTKQFAHSFMQQNVRDRFAVHGIGSERLILTGQLARDGYLAPYQQVDIALDPFPYPGITTSVEALWMGVPVLTLAGKSFLSRQGVGLMTNAGLPAWIAGTPDEYVALAKAHAGDLEKLAQIRSELRKRLASSPIFDSVPFAKHFEEALRGMWQKWCALLS